MSNAKFTMREGLTLDVAGNVWTHPAVDLKKDDRSDAVILTFSCDRIQTESTSEGERPYTYLVFLDALEFPENVTKTTTVESGGALHSQAIRREGSKGSVSGMHVSYDARRNMPGEKYSEFFARASDGTSVPPNFQDRLLEALRFCTATMAAPEKWPRLFEQHSPIYKWSPGGLGKMQSCPLRRATRGASGISFYAASASLGSKSR
jgi:hypothetical protein